jgi:hypothetical protein
MVGLPSQQGDPILDDGSKISICDAHEAIHGCVRNNDCLCLSASEHFDSCCSRTDMALSK